MLSKHSPRSLSVWSCRARTTEWSFCSFVKAGWPPGTGLAPTLVSRGPAQTHVNTHLGPCSAVGVGSAQGVEDTEPWHGLVTTYSRCVKQVRSARVETKPEGKYSNANIGAVTRWSRVELKERDSNKATGVWEAEHPHLPPPLPGSQFLTHKHVLDRLLHGLSGSQAAHLRTCS